MDEQPLPSEWDADGRGRMLFIEETANSRFPSGS